MADLSRLPYVSINAKAKSTGDKNAKSEINAKAKIDKKGNARSFVSVLGNDVADCHQDTKGQTVFNQANVEAGEGSFISQIARAKDFGVNMLDAKTSGSDIFQKGDLNIAKITGDDNVYESDTNEKGLNVLEIDGNGNAATTDASTLAIVGGKDNKLNTGDGDDVVIVNSDSAQITDSSKDDHDIAIIDDKARGNKIEGYETIVSKDGKELVWDEKQGKYIEKGKAESDEGSHGKSTSADKPAFAFIGFAGNPDSNKAQSTEAPTFGIIGFIPGNEANKSTENICEYSQSNSTQSDAFSFEKLFAMFAALFSMFNFLDA